MPSPFPGMDPYVEHSEFFPDFHDRFVPSICDALQARLPEPYYAMLGSRVWIDVAERIIKPDVDVLHPKASVPEQQVDRRRSLSVGQAGRR